MPDKGAVLLPQDLIDAIVRKALRTGWFGGSKIQSERLFVVTEATIGEESILSKDFPRLLKHRAFQIGIGEISHEIMRWSLVEKGFSERFPLAGNDPAEVSLALGLDVATEKFVCVIEPDNAMSPVRPLRLASNATSVTLWPLDVFQMVGPEPFKRLPEEETRILETKSVCIVGLGSGGGQIAINLACAGVGTLILADSDRIEPANYIRHPLNGRDFGRLKVRGIETDLSDRELPTKVLIETNNILVWADDFRESFRKHRPDLIICATDSRESRRFINYCAIAFGIPAIVAGILDDGKIGEVLLVEPRRSACYECVRLELGAALEKPSSDERPSTPYVAGEILDLQSATHRFDLGFVTSLATRLALQVLNPLTFTAVPANYVVFGREKTNYSPPFKFDLPLSLNYAPITKRDDCPVCGQKPTDLDEIDLEASFKGVIDKLDEVQN